MQLLLAVMLALSITPALAQDESFPEGRLLLGRRVFQRAEIARMGTQVYNFQVVHFDTEQNATLAISKSIENLERVLDPVELAEVSGPDVHEDSVWVVATVRSQGEEGVVTGLLFRVKATVHLWATVTFFGDSVSELIELSTAFKINVPDEITEDNILTMLPGLDDLPTFGFKLAEEKVEVGDSLATPEPR